jgi:DNA-binding transcriptional LysR family regulator
VDTVSFSPRSSAHDCAAERAFFQLPAPRASAEKCSNDPVASLENFRLTVFRAVAEHLSFRKAAEHLFLTQPAVSLQIKALEEDLGIQLFDRTGTHIALTASGKVLLEYASQAHALLSQAQHAIAAVSGEQAGDLPLGASTTIAQYVVPGILGDFRRRHPRVSLTLMSGNTEEIVTAIEQRKIALGLIEGPARSRDIRTEPFLLDELVLIAPAAHEWAERASISPADLPGAPLLLRERGSGTRNVVEAALERHGIRRRALQVLMELDSTESIKSAVEAGLGAGFVSRWALAKDARLGNAFKIVTIERLRIERPFLIACPTGPEPHGPAAEFRRFLLMRTSAPRNPLPSRPANPPAVHKNRK